MTEPSAGTPRPGEGAEAADLEPLDVDGVGAVATGTVLWLVALLVLLPFRDRLAAHDTTWWLWVCVAGAGLGVLGLPYVIRRRSAYRRHRADSAGSSGGAEGSGTGPAPGPAPGQDPPRSMTS